MMTHLVLFSNEPPVDLKNSKLMYVVPGCHTAMFVRSSCDLRGLRHSPAGIRESVTPYQASCMAELGKFSLECSHDLHAADL